MSDPGQRSSLSGLFRDFYGQVMEFRRQLAGDSGLTPAAAREPLLATLAATEPGCEDSFATDSQSLQQARYLLACFADDLLGRDGAPDGAGWRESTLESELFQSDEGGGEIFRRLDELLEVGDPGRRDLAGAYLLALTLGFRGRLAGSEGEPALRDYRQRLLALAAPERRADDAAQWITPTAYRHTVGRVGTALLPGLRLWGWIAGGAVLLLLVVSYLVFAEETSGIAAAVERILDRGLTR